VNLNPPLIVDKASALELACSGSRLASCCFQNSWQKAEGFSKRDWTIYQRSTGQSLTPNNSPSCNLFHMKKRLQQLKMDVLEERNTENDKMKDTFKGNICAPGVVPPIQSLQGDHLMDDGCPQFKNMELHFDFQAHQHI